LRFTYKKPLNRYKKEGKEKKEEEKKKEEKR
jgi:hypothetical protein